MAYLFILQNFLQNLRYISCWAAHFSHLYLHWIGQVFLIIHIVNQRSKVPRDNFNQVKTFQRLSRFDGSVHKGWRRINLTCASSSISTGMVALKSKVWYFSGRFRITWIRIGLGVISFFQKVNNTPKSRMGWDKVATKYEQTHWTLCLPLNWHIAMWT